MFHLAALVTLALRPGSWPWVLGLLACNQLALAAAVLLPRSRLLGPNRVRLPDFARRRRQVALTFDDGPDPDVTPQVLELLDRYHAKASFFCIGERAAAHPEVVREIARRGHSVENHSYGHRYAFAFYGLSRLRREVDSAQSVIAGITGVPPRFFRAPAGFRSPFLDAVLARRELHYVSWTRRGFDAGFFATDPLRVLQRLVRGLAAGDVLLLHDRAHTRTQAGQPIVLAVLPGLLDRLAALGLSAVSLPAACEAETPEHSAGPAHSILPAGDGLMPERKAPLREAPRQWAR